MPAPFGGVETPSGDQSKLGPRESRGLPSLMSFCTPITLKVYKQLSLQVFFLCWTTRVAHRPDSFDFLFNNFDSFEELIFVLIFPCSLSTCTTG